MNSKTPLENPAPLQKDFLAAFTILELLIAIILLSIMVVGFGSINVYSTFQTNDSRHRQKLHNEVYIALEHMNNWITRAVGNEIIDGTDSVINNNNSLRIIASIDSGVRIAYRLFTSGPNQNEIRFCSDCGNDVNCNACKGGNWNNKAELVAHHYIVNLVFTKPEVGDRLTENNVRVDIAACWDPTIPESVDNPCISMGANIFLPSVSTN